MSLRAMSKSKWVYSSDGDQSQITSRGFGKFSLEHKGAPLPKERSEQPHQHYAQRREAVRRCRYGSCCRIERNSARTVRSASPAIELVSEAIEINFLWCIGSVTLDSQNAATRTAGRGIELDCYRASPSDQKSRARWCRANRWKNRCPE